MLQIIQTFQKCSRAQVDYFCWNFWNSKFWAQKDSNFFMSEEIHTYRFYVSIGYFSFKFYNNGYCNVLQSWLCFWQQLVLSVYFIHIWSVWNRCQYVAFEFALMGLVFFSCLLTWGLSTIVLHMPSFVMDWAMSPFYGFV